MPEAVTSTSRLLNQSNRAGMRFLLAETELGLTFLSSARTTALSANRERSLNHARQAYELVRTMLPRISPLPEEQQELDRKLADLRRGLLLAGVSLSA